MNKIKVEIFGKITAEGKTKYLSFGIHDEEKIRGIMERLRQEKPEWIFSERPAKTDW